MPPPPARQRASPILQGFPPIVGNSPRVLILGSMPGAASLQAGAYYAHPRNLFWSFMGTLLGAHPGLPYAERAQILVSAGVAVWDVLARCEREGSLDSAIRDASAAANDFEAFFASHPTVQAVLFNGAKAEASYRKLVAPRQEHGPRSYLRLPSTSPANASQAAAAKREAWRRALHDAGLALVDGT